MSWSKVTAEDSNGNKLPYLVATETLTLGTGNSDVSSSVIDFIPPDKDFVVIANTGATDLSADADVAVDICATYNGTFVQLKDDLITSIDDAVAAATYDVSANGQAPFYKVRIDPDGVEAGESVTVSIIVPGTG